MDDDRTIAYCPSCNVTLGHEGRYARSVSHAQVHATVTGHPVHVVSALNWSVVETLSGEPSLPLWDFPEISNEGGAAAPS